MHVIVQVMHVDAYAVATLGDGSVVRFGRVSLRVDHDEAGQPAPLHQAEFPGMALASDRSWPGMTLYLTPRWNVVLHRYREHGDRHAVGTLHVLGPFDQLRSLAAAAGVSPELVAEAEGRAGELFGQSIPNDFDALPSMHVGSWQHLDV